MITPRIHQWVCQYLILSDASYNSDTKTIGRYECEQSVSKPLSVLLFSFAYKVDLKVCLRNESHHL